MQRLHALAPAFDLISFNDASAQECIAFRDERDELLLAVGDPFHVKSVTYLQRRSHENGLSAQVVKGGGVSQERRREFLKGLGAAAIGASGVAPIFCSSVAAAPALHYTPETGAELKMLRWKTFVQGDETQWLANTRLFTERTGVRIQFENVNLSDIRQKAHLAASIGAGPDILMTGADDPQLYPDKCLDLTDLADYLGDKYGGWYEACRKNCTVGNRWVALGAAFFPARLVYRKSKVAAAGFNEIPPDLPGFLKLCRALKSSGEPAGLALNNSVDASIWCHWLIWAHGARLVDENNRVAINSKATIAALEYSRALYSTFVSGTLSWTDANNNKAFLAGEISLTYNTVSIYHVAKTSSDERLKKIAADIAHAHMPIGPVGRRTEYAGFSPILIFNYTKYPNAAREYLRFMFEHEQYEAWQEAAGGYISEPLRAFNANPIWTSDPKLEPYKDGGAHSLYPAYPGTVGHASAACLADAIIVNMVAEAASGQASPKEAAARAEERARRHYKA
jgi:multiple sugar transport system substrate-binding protein